MLDGLRGIFTQSAPGVLPVVVVGLWSCFPRPHWVPDEGSGFCWSCRVLAVPGSVCEASSRSLSCSQCRRCTEASWSWASALPPSGWRFSNLSSPYQFPSRPHSCSEPLPTDLYCFNGWQDLQHSSMSETSLMDHFPGIVCSLPCQTILSLFQSQCDPVISHCWRCFISDIQTWTQGWADCLLMFRSQIQSSLWRNPNWV